MSQLAPLKQKIKSIQTTKKITHAVRLVSMSFYSKLEKQSEPISYYSKSIKSLFIMLRKQFPQWQSATLFPEDVLDKRPLFIIVSTSKGLCGSLNSNLWRYITKSVFTEKHQEPEVIAIGRKAIKQVEELKIGRLLCTYNELNSNNFQTITDDLLEKVVNTKTPYSSVVFFSNELRTFFLQKPLKTTLIPVCFDDEQQEPASRSDDQELNPDDIIWEQDGGQILDRLALMYLKSSVMNTLYQALLAEHAARFTAMDGSYTNADKILENLTLTYNKKRQALITREVAELTSCMSE